MGYDRDRLVRPAGPGATPGISRREFLTAGAALAATSIAPALSAPRSVGAATQPLPPLPMRPAVRVAAVGVQKDAPIGVLGTAIREAALAATDFSWLSPGDRVLLKVVCNSANPYPATTHPAAVSVMASLLRERGAVVYVGDQSGVEAVHHTASKQRGSTRECMRNAGLEGAALHAQAAVAGFEEAGYDAYFAAEPPADSHYRREIWVPSLVREVDHIVYLPRVSKHLIAGSTLGLKGAVGWLREDSRLELHRDAASFLEKCAEINGCREIRERLRLTLSVGTQLQTSLGPDSGHVATPDVGLVFASENLIDHDVFSLAYLLEVSEQATPWSARALDPYPTLSSPINRAFVGLIWGASQLGDSEGYSPPRLDSPWSCRVLHRGCQIFGGRPDRLAVENINGSVPPVALAGITRRAAQTSP
ncbi:DUF362 domain-containing protein [Candidatus Binatia bacterium]|nr:DUF362 domain-containing protein [Candidatus Binatia bacterium]